MKQPRAPSRAWILTSLTIDSPLVRSVLGLEGDQRDRGGRLVMVGGTKRVRVQKASHTCHEPRHETVHRARDYPTSTDQWCWHCCHPFDTQPLPMPVKYDERRDIFHVMGTFCSFACMKAYNGESASYLKYVNANNITLFHKRCTGRLRGIRRAPPRVALRVFGGHMSIEEFRASSERAVEYCVLPPRMIVHSQALHETELAAQRHTAASARKPAADLHTVVDFKDVSTKNETLRLKRPKPLQNSRNLLERTMGINAFCGAPAAAAASGAV